ncbi:MAG: SusC/RagA family TonB-linked outer membrane protein [Saprospiraceae bacterium]
MKRNLHFFFVFFLCCTSLAAQQRLISGTITDEENVPLIGANVLVVGTTSGTVTDFEGKFNLSIPQGAEKLEISYTGYTSKQVLLTSASEYEIVLAEDNIMLGEVVVTAIGVERERRTLGYSLQEVASDDIVKSRESNLVNALAGKVAGLQVNSSGGQAGSASRILLRGITSITGNNSPLFVIDGVPLDNSASNAVPNVVESNLFNGNSSNRLIDIDPNIIEDITVLKGAAATSLYGVQGANGAILITTKNGLGQQSRLNVDISSTFGVNTAIIRGYQDQYLQGSGGNYRNGLPLGAGGFRSLDPATNPNGFTATQGSTSWGPHKDAVDQFTLDSIGQPKIYDPRDDFYRDGQTWENSVSLSGNNNGVGYSFTFSNLQEQGIVPTNDFKRNALSAKVSVPFSDKVRYEGFASFVNSDSKRLSEGNGQRSFLFALNFWPISHDITNYYTEDGTYYSYHPTAFNNPVWLAENNGYYSNTDRFIFNQALTVELAPWLKLTERFGADTYHTLIEDQVNIGTRGFANGRTLNTDITNRILNNDLILSADRRFSDTWQVNVAVGNNVYENTFKRDILRGIGLSIPGFYDISNSGSVEAFENDISSRSYAVYGTGMVGFKDMLFLNLTARNEWSSTLPLNHNSFFYPSASLGFEFTELLPNIRSVLSYGKLRASWAQAGNTAPAYSVIQTFTQSSVGDGTRGTISVPSQGQVLYELSNIKANENLTNELIEEVEFGADLRFFNGRLGIDASVYDRRSRDQVLSAPVAPSTGYVAKVVNVGEIQNKGVEVSLTANPIRAARPGAFDWNLQVNYARNRTTVNALAEGVESIRLFGFTSPLIQADVTNGYGVIWGSRFARTSEGELIIGEDGLPIQDDALGPIGNVMPDWTGSIRSTFNFKNFTLSGLLDARIGGDILNFDLFYSTFYGTSVVTEDRGSVVVWDGVYVDDDGQITGENNIPVVKDEGYYQNFYSNISELFVEDGSFLKLRELSLGYRFPQKVLDRTLIRSLEITGIARNLFIHSNFTYFDPEGSLDGAGNGQGFYHSVTPGTKTFALALKVGF